jgi:hypothetical protein
MGTKGIRKRKPYRRLPSLRGKAHYIDEPPVMWPSSSSGFEADPFSPAGQIQGVWRLTGGGTDTNEAEARAHQRRLGRTGAFILRLLGWKSPKKNGESGAA